MTLSIFFHLQPSCPSGSASVLARNQETPTLPMMYVPNHSISFQFDPNNSLLFQSNPKKFHLITGWGWWCRACPCWWLRRRRGRRRGRGNFFAKTKKIKFYLVLLWKICKVAIATWILGFDLDLNFLFKVQKILRKDQCNLKPQNFSLVVMKLAYLTYLQFT